MTWGDTRLGDFVTLKRGYDLPSSRRTYGCVPVVSSSGVTGHHGTAKVKGPGVVTGRYGTLGDVFFIAEDFWPLNTSLYVQDFKGNDPKFSAYFLRSILTTTRGDKAAVPGVNRNDLHALSVRVTLDIDEQKTIAFILSSYDDLIENNRQRIRLLEQAVRLIYKEWFVRLRFRRHEHVKIIDGIPEGWERRTLGAVCQAVGGGTPSTSKPAYWRDGGIPWYTPTDITRNSCLALLDSEKKITEAGLQNSSAKMLPTGTVLMTSRASVGFFGIIEKPSCTNQGFISILPNDPCARMYLLLNLMHRVAEIRSHAGGSTYREISKAKFKTLSIIMPDSALLREFEERASDLHAQIRTLHTMNQRLGQARDLLLPRLMNGTTAVEEFKAWNEERVDP